MLRGTKLGGGNAWGLRDRPKTCLDSVLCTISIAWEGSRKKQVCLASSLGLINGLGEPEEELSLGRSGDWVNMSSASETTWEWRQHRTTCEEAVVPHSRTCFSLHSLP